MWVEQPRSDYLDIRKCRSLQFFLGKNQRKHVRAKHVRPAVGCTNSNESSSRTATGLPNQSSKGYPNLADRLNTDTPVTIPDATNNNFCQLRVKIFSGDCRPRDSRITQEKDPRFSLFLSHTWRPITCVFKNISFRVDRAGFCRKSVRRNANSETVGPFALANS